MKKSNELMIKMNLTKKPFTKINSMLYNILFF